jgi:predicted lipoprotein with Yx(FWY)xxD motif
MKRLTIAALTIVAALGVTGVALASSAHTAASGTVVKTKKTSLGTILVDGKGRTLYLDVADKPGKQACTGSCLTFWPPLKAVGKVTAKGAAKAADLGSAKGARGKQVTYNGHFLYYFANDTKDSPMEGQGENGFFVVSPAGSKITKAANAAPSTGATTTTTTTSSSSSAYHYGY